MYVRIIWKGATRRNTKRAPKPRNNLFTEIRGPKIIVTPKYDIKCFQYCTIIKLYYDVYMILFVRTRREIRTYIIYYILYRLIILENVFYNSLCVFLFTRVLQVISDIVIDKKKENNGKKDEIQILPYY